MTESQFKEIVPALKHPEVFLIHLNIYMLQYEINSFERITAFVAQLAHESGSFKYTREIASGNAYEGREDLGNIYPGDGPKFKGHGLIQITGRSNHKECSRALFGDDRLLANPEILCTPEFAVASACWFWQSRGLNEIADNSDTWVRTWRKKKYNKFQWITIRINGGLNGYDDRLAFYNRAKIALT